MSRKCLYFLVNRTCEFTNQWIMISGITFELQLLPTYSRTFIIVEAEMKLTFATSQCAMNDKRKSAAAWTFDVVILVTGLVLAIVPKATNARSSMSNSRTCQSHWAVIQVH